MFANQKQNLDTIDESDGSGQTPQVIIKDSSMQRELGVLVKGTKFRFIPGSLPDDCDHIDYNDIYEAIGREPGYYYQFRVKSTTTGIEDVHHCDLIVGIV